MKGLIEESEKRGTEGIKSHASIIKNKIITVNVIKKLSSKWLKSQQKDLTIKIYGNTSVWELKEIIATKLGIPAGILKIYLGNNSDSNICQEISNRDHGKTLNELKIKDGETFTLLKNNILGKMTRPNLLNEKGDLSDRIIVSVEEIFEHYSTRGQMSINQCVSFINTAFNSNEPYTIDDYMIVSIFEKYDSDNTNFLSVNAFKLYFRNSIDYGSRNNIVWNILKRLGYRNDLRKFSQPIEGFSREKQFLPRNIISSNKTHFEEIFSLQDENETIAKEANTFLSLISTNHMFYKNLISLESKLESNSQNHNSWEDVINSTNYYK